VLTALSAGGQACVWTPRAFLRHPSRWLADFASRRLTHYSGPNFSFDAMADAYDPAAMGAVDLSAWRVAVNGAEAVSVRTIRRFLERFGPHGYRPSTMVPAYGMAEATLVATVSPLDRDPRAIFVDRAALAGEGRAVPVAGTAEGSRALVSVGPCVPGMHLRVVGGDGRQVDDGQVGEIQLSGDSVSDGYFRRDWRRGSGWLATGDLGIVVAGELYVVGRSKDVIIVRGVKYHPEDIEPIVADLREARGRRCGVVAHGETDESIAVVLETRLSGAELQQLRHDIRATLVRRLGISRIEVLLVEPRTIPVTSSGKIRRRELHDRLEAGLLHDLEESPATTAAPASR
jgi:acyl-CoA synthetase (AMP-forming)/AMP-acid ligase II